MPVDPVILQLKAEVDQYQANLTKAQRHTDDKLDAIEKRGASLRILAMNLDTHTPTGKLMLNVIGSVAQFEREIMLERQREGIQKAKREGKYTGRKPTAQAKRDDIVALMETGMNTAEVARQLKISRSSVYRVMEREVG